MKKRVALFHPWIKSKGGGEKVVLEILKSKKYDVDVYTWVYNPSKTFSEFKKYNINVIAPKFAERFSRYFLLRSIFLPISFFSKIPLEKYDLFLISTSGLAEIITFRNYKKGGTFAYVHTPLRAATKDIIKWNLNKRYKNIFSKAVYLLSTRIYNLLERRAWKNIDWAIFNSELSFKRAKDKKLVENADVIYPPVDVDKFKKINIKEGNYFLCVSRFNNNKRQDLLLDVWKKFVKMYPDKKLILAGGIENKRYYSRLKKKAAGIKNIEFIVSPSDKKIVNLYAGCLAGIFVPYQEDFGIVPFEFLAAGKPLIAVDKGGYVNLIKGLPQVYLAREGDNLEQELIDNMKRFLKDSGNKKERFTLPNNFVKEIEKSLKRHSSR